MRTVRMRVLAALAIALGALAVPAAAQAVAPTSVNVFFGLPPAVTTEAGDETEYTITFTAPNGLDSNPGTAVIVRAAPLGPPPPTFASGTIFPPSALHDDEGAFYAVGTADDPGNVVVADVIRSDGNEQVVIPTALTGLNASPGETVTVTIGYVSEHKVQNRPTPCDDCVLAVALAPPNPVGPADFGFSTPFDVVEGPGELTVEAGNDQATTVGSAFGTDLEAKLVDGAGDPLDNENVTFTAPASGPSGTFAGGDDEGRSYTTTTDASGIATASALTANGTAGLWSVAVSTDVAGIDPIEFDLENEVGPADAVDLVLDPPAIPGNGVATSQATATVTDEFGNPTPGLTVTFSSDGSQDISGTQELLGGRYRATITSTPEAGLFTITADVTEGSSPTDSAGLAQTADTTAPQMKILEHPKKRSPKKRARFAFDTNSGDTDTIECKLDGGGYEECDSPRTYRVGKGRHRFKVRATDLAGNTGPADTFKFTRTKKR